MTSAQLLIQFIQYLETEKRYSAHSVVAYQKDLEQFIEFSDVDSLEDWQEITHKLVRAWIVTLIDNANTMRTVNRKLSSLRTFFKWAQRNGYIYQNPMQKVLGPKQEKRLPHFLKESEVNKTKTDLLFGSDFESIRDELLFEFFYQTGIRLSELVELKSLDVQKDRIKVLGKRNKERIIPIGIELHEKVKVYLEMKKQNNFSQDCFFVLNNGEKVYSKFVYRKINSYLARVTNMEKKSPHVLRHTFATHMLNNGAGLETLKDLLGHASLSATQVYTHSSITQLTNIYSQAHPRGRKKD